MSSPRSRGSQTRRVSRPPPAHLYPIAEEGALYKRVPTAAAIGSSPRAVSKAHRATRRAMRHARGLKPVPANLLRAACRSNSTNQRTVQRRAVAKLLGLC